MQLAFLTSQVLPQARFLLVGDGALRKKIEKLIAEFNLGPQFILTGWRRDIPKVLSAMDVFVLTSLWEGLPIAVLEAMVSRVPVVATHTGGISEVIAEGETGFQNWLSPTSCAANIRVSKKKLVFRQLQTQKRISNLNLV